MTSRATLAALCCLAVLGACATTPAPGADGTPAVRPPTGPAALWSAALAGRYAEVRRDPERAALYLERALPWAPADLSLPARAVREQVLAGRVPAAAALAGGVAADARPAIARLALGAEAFARRDWAGARAAASPRAPGLIDGLALASVEAWARVAGGDTAAAGVFEASAFQPSAAERRLAALFQAPLLEAAGREEDAVRAYARAWEQGLRLAPTAVRYGALLERTGAKAAALTLYETALQQTPGNLALDKAMARLRAGEAPPGPPTPQQGLGEAFLTLGLLAASQADGLGAVAQFQLALAVDPAQDLARVMLGQAQIDAGQGEAGRRTLAGLPRRSAYFESARLAAAWSYLRDDRAADAIASAQQTYALTRSADARQTLADLHRANNDFAEADRLYSQVIAERSVPVGTDWRLYFARGAVRERLNRWPEAESDLKQALELSPNQPDVLNYLAYTWVERGENLDRALVMLRTAAAARPRSGAVIDSLGWALFKLGRYEESLEKLETAIDLSPADPEINDHLGDVYQALGRSAEARFQWRRALSFNPEAEDRARIEAKLAAAADATTPKRDYAAAPAP